jgi:hypothetical protein
MMRYSLSVTSNMDTKITSVIMSLMQNNYHNSNIHYRFILTRLLQYNNPVTQLYTNYNCLDAEKEL